MIDSKEITKWEGICRVIVGRYFPPPGLDRDDLLQEARIGVYKGLRDFRAERGSPLSNFIGLCVERQIQSAIKTARTGKQRHINDAITTAPNEEGTLSPVLELLPSPDPGPMERVLQHERLSELSRAVRENLSDLERTCLLIVLLNGLTYRQASAQLRQSEKTIDNALQRVRRKLAPVWEAAA